MSTETVLITRPVSLPAWNVSIVHLKKLWLTWQDMCGMDHTHNSWAHRGLEQPFSLNRLSASLSAVSQRFQSKGFSCDSPSVSATLKGLLDSFQVQGPGPDCAQSLTAGRQSGIQRQSEGSSPSGICHLVFLMSPETTGDKFEWWRYPRLRWRVLYTPPLYATVLFVN